MTRNVCIQRVHLMTKSVYQRQFWPQRQILLGSFKVCLTMWCPDGGGRYARKSARARRLAIRWSVYGCWSSPMPRQCQREHLTLKRSCSMPRQPSPSPEARSCLLNWHLLHAAFAMIVICGGVDSTVLWNGSRPLPLPSPLPTHLSIVRCAIARELRPPHDLLIWRKTLSQCLKQSTKP